MSKDLELDPDLLPGWVLKGNLLSELERYEEALVAYDHALAAGIK